MNTNDNMEQRIREVAQELFFKQGYALTSTTQIAKEVGCTQALVHYYYRTKENLFRQIFLEQIQAALNVIGQSLMNEDSFDKFIEHAISMYFDTLMSNPRLPFFVLEERQARIAHQCVEVHRDGVLDEFVERILVHQRLSDDA